MKGYFVTGTDTGVGKTHVTAELARYAVSVARRVFAFKPIETGCKENREGVRVGEDQEAIAIAAGNWQEGPLRGVYRLSAPLAPYVAANREGVEIDLDLIRTTYDLGLKGTDLAIVEGAGGWRVPITEKLDTAALATVVALPIIVVARATLGTINHTLLTVEAIQKDNHLVAAVIMSVRPEDEEEAAMSNAAEIERRSRVRVLLSTRREWLGSLA